TGPLSGDLGTPVTASTQSHAAGSPLSDERPQPTGWQIPQRARMPYFGDLVGAVPRVVEDTAGLTASVLEKVSLGRSIPATPPIHCDAPFSTLELQMCRYVRAIPRPRTSFWRDVLCVLGRSRFSQRVRPLGRRPAVGLRRRIVAIGQGRL